MKLYVNMFIIFFLIIGIPIAFVENTDVTLQIKNFDAELVDAFGLVVNIYQDEKNNLFRVI